MVRKEQSFKRKTVTHWTLSYLFATLIPLLMVLVVALLALYMNSSSITYSNNIAASYVQDSFRNVLTRINEMKAEIIVDNDFNDIRNAASLSEMSSLELSYHASDIRRLELSNTNIERLFLFSPQNDWYITHHSWGKLSEMAENGYLSLSQDDINEFLRSEVWDVYMYDLSEKDILIILPMTYILSSNRNNLTVGVVVSKNVLFPSVIDSYHDVVIYSERQDAIVYSFSGKYKAGVKNEHLSAMKSGTTERFEKSIASVGDNPILGLKCIVLMDRSLYFHDYYLIILIIALVFFSAVIFGGIIIRRSVKKDWISYLEAAEASGLDLESVPLESNAYTPFVSSVSDLKAQKEDLSDQIVKQRSSLVDSAIRKLLGGDTTVTKETLSALGVELVSDYFCVVIATSEKADVGAYLKAQSPKTLILPFQSEYSGSFLINAVHSEDEYFNKLVSHAKEEAVLDSFSISLLHTGLKSIQDSYIEAISVHEYQKDHDIAYMSYSELISSTRQNTYQYTLEENMMLQKALKEGEGEKAKAIVNKVIERNRENGVSPKTLRFLLFSISGTIIRTINSLDSHYSEGVPEIKFPPILQSLNFQKSLSGVEEIIDVTCYSIKAMLPSADASSETYQIYKKVLSYIHDNCSNAMMNVSSIADNFDISIAYLSRIFKKYYGSNISEYITNYRLDKAKELLSEGEKVNDVVDKCGFGSLRTFARVFKTVEGITPGQYKSSVSKES